MGTTYELIPTTKILEPGHKLRDTIDPERLGELADSMAAEGLHQPIGVRGPNEAGFYEIIWGHRRYLASKLLLWSGINARVFPLSFDPMVAAISENLQRVDLDPIEEARAVHKLLHQGRAIAEIARLFRRSQAWVSQRLELLGFHPDLIDAIQNRGLKLIVAQQLQDVTHDGYRRELIEEALRTGATATVAAVWRQHYLADADRIAKNNMVIEEIKHRREAWVIYVPCQGCGHDTDYRETETWRFCTGCSEELRAQLRAPQETSNNSPSPSSPTAQRPEPALQAGIEPASGIPELAGARLPGI